jgi:hypothetical protein
LFKDIDCLDGKRWNRPPISLPIEIEKYSRKRSDLFSLSRKGESDAHHIDPEEEIFTKFAF